MQEKKTSYSLISVTLLLLVILILGMIISISLGAASIDFSEVWTAVFSPNREITNHVVIHDVRLPRVLAGILVGACFAVAGAMMQGITRNPLADSGILGINGGATLGIALTFAFTNGRSFNQLLLVAFIGAALATILVFGLSWSAKGSAMPFRLTMTGAVVSALLLALSQGIALYYNLSQDLAFWSAGGLSGVGWEQLAKTFPIIIIAILGAIIISPSITILNLGDEIATSLGQKTTLIRILSILIILTLAGIAVALAGNIAYVGLIIPHIVKLLIGGKYQHIIPVSALAGGVFILIADIAARLINAPEETPIGALTALVGVPFFIYLIKTKGGNN